MAQATKTRGKELIVDETIIELQDIEDGEFHLCGEYLIEIVKEDQGKGYCAKIYQLVAASSPCRSPRKALEESMNFLNSRR